MNKAQTYKDFHLSLPKYKELGYPISKADLLQIIDLFSENKQNAFYYYDLSFVSQINLFNSNLVESLLWNEYV